MNQNSRLYDHEYIAQNYDAWSAVSHPEKNKQRENFILELATQYGKEGILDVACGTGSLSCLLAQKGFNVVGLDLAKDMLDIARNKKAMLAPDTQKNLRFVESSMVNFNLGETFSFATISFCGFGHLLTQQEQIETLRMVSNHLTPGSVLCIDSHWPNYELIVQNRKYLLTQRKFLGSFMNKAGNQVDRYERAYFEPDQQQILGEKIFMEIDQKTHIETEYTFPIKMRWTFPSEFQLLFNLTGFDVISNHREYTKEVIKYPEDIVWIVKKR